jgi:hypothetical protein
MILYCSILLHCVYLTFSVLLRLFAAFVVLLLSDISGLHIEGRPPWREDGSVIYSYNLLSLSSPSPTELTTTFYCLFWHHILLSHTRLPQPGVGVLLAADSQSTSSSGYRASLWDPWPDFYLALLTSTDSYYFLLSKASSLTRKRVCSLQCNHSLVRSLTPNNHTLPSHLRLCSLFVASYDSQGLRWKYSNPPPHGVPQPVGPGSCIYTPQEQGGPVIPPGTGFPFRHLLRLSGLRWRYSNLPPHGSGHSCYLHCKYISDMFQPKWPSSGV